MDSEKIVSVTFDSSLSNLCEANSSFDTGVLRICYTGDNRNGSAFSRADIERNLHTIYNCPVVCNYDRDTDTFGGHDIEVVADNSGTLRIVNLTQPVGVIPESANVWFEEYEEQDGTKHEYLYADVLLWKRQEAYQKIKRDGVSAHSMEVTVKNGETVDGVYHIHDFEFTAFALIGVEPCFEGSALEMFSADGFKAQYAQMMRELKEEYSKVITAEAVDDKDITVKGGEKVLEQKIELAAQYGINVEELEFSIDEMTIEELTEKFEAMSAKADEVVGENSEDPVEEPVEEAAEEQAAEFANDEPVEPATEDEEFALNSNIVEELRQAVRSVTYVDRWGDACRKYWFVDCDMESSMVYCEDEENWGLYGFSYSLNGDTVNIDFDSKKRMKWVIAEFNEGDQDSAVTSMFNEMGQKIADNAEWEAKYHTASETIESMQSELNELKQFKADVELTEAKNARDEVFAMFEELNGVEAFEALKNDCDQYDAASLEEKCFAIRGRVGIVSKFANKDSAPKIKVDKDIDAAKEPYGGLFIKYGVQK